MQSAVRDLRAHTLLKAALHHNLDRKDNKRFKDRSRTAGTQLSLPSSSYLISSATLPKPKLRTPEESAAGSLIASISSIISRQAFRKFFRLTFSLTILNGTPSRLIEQRETRSARGGRCTPSPSRIPTRGSRNRPWSRPRRGTLFRPCRPRCIAKKFR